MERILGSGAFFISSAYPLQHQMHESLGGEALCYILMSKAHRI